MINPYPASGCGCRLVVATVFSTVIQNVLLTLKLQIKDILGKLEHFGRFSEHQRLRLDSSFQVRIGSLLRLRERLGI